MTSAWLTIPVVTGQTNVRTLNCDTGPETVAIVEVVFLCQESHSLARRWRHLLRRRRICAGRSLNAVRCGVFLVGSLLVHHLGATTDPDLSGFDFEISKRINCDEAINVVVSKVGESKKALIFQFFPPDDDEIPAIRPIGDGTVQISIPRVPFIYCQRDRWETLVVKYDIGVVENHLGRPDEC